MTPESSEDTSDNLLANRKTHYSTAVKSSIGLGLVLRLIEYAWNRSLWVDEASLALNVLDLPWPELLQPLRHNQAAPPGFLALTKTVTMVADRGELALRFIPLLGGLVSVILFVHVARKVLDRKALLLATFLFAISGHLVYYSAEFKQYSVDLATCLGLTWLFFVSLDNPLGKARIAVLIAAGSTAVWLSHASVFVLFAGGIVLQAAAINRGSRKRMLQLSLVGSTWLLSFAALYTLNLRHVSHNGSLEEFWSHSFMPLGLPAIPWTIQKMLGLFANPVGLTAVGLTCVCFVWGTRDVFAKSPRKALVLVLPILAAFLASAAHRYPFNGRLLLFTVPAVLICVSRGASRIASHARNQARWLSVAFVALLVFHPAVSAVRGALRGPGREEVRPVLKYVDAEAEPGDRLYVYYGARNPFRYYRKRMDLPDLRIEYGEEARNNWDSYKSDVCSLKAC